ARGAASAAKHRLQSPQQAGDPPDTFPGPAGAELTHYIDAGQILDASDVYDELGLREAFPDALLERLTADGAIYSVPSNIHRSNVVWGSAAALTEAGIDPSTPPATMDEFLVQLDALDAAGVRPMSIGAAWTQANLLEAILMADLGAAAYNGLVDGSTA